LVTVTHGAGAGASASTIRIVINTAELVEAARMGPSCADVRFEAQMNKSHTFGGAVAGAYTRPLFSST
jgi:hypothetical protein